MDFDYLDFNYNENFLYFYSNLLKAYKTFTSQGLEAFDLSPIEVEILKFLFNNGSHFRTAKDIAKYKAVSKSLVSKGVASLVEKGYLESRQDPSDKRVAQLYIKPLAQPIVDRLSHLNKLFYEKSLEGISQEDLATLKSVHLTILANVEEIKLEKNREDTHVKDKKSK